MVFELTELFPDEFRREALDEGVIPPVGDPDGQHQIVGGFEGVDVALQVGRQWANRAVAGKKMVEDGRLVAARVIAHPGRCGDIGEEITKRAGVEVDGADLAAVEEEVAGMEVGVDQAEGLSTNADVLHGRFDLVGRCVEEIVVALGYDGF